MAGELRTEPRDIIRILTNLGIDTTCGACMEVGFTGTTTNLHTCDDRKDHTELRAAEPMLQFFEYSHLPETLQAVSRDFCALAFKTVRDRPRNPERTVALRKLLEAKDAAVRAALYK
jgi:hypothetical protein